MRERMIYYHVYPLLVCHSSVDYAYPYSPGNQVSYKQQPETKTSTTITLLSKYIYDHYLISGIRSGVFFRLGLSMRFAELEFSVKQLRSSAGFGGRLQRPSPCRVRSAPRREHGRMPSQTSEKLQKYRMSTRNSGDFRCIFTSAVPG